MNKAEGVECPGQPSSVREWFYKFHWRSFRAPIPLRVSLPFHRRRCGSREFSRSLSVESRWQCSSRLTERAPAGRLVLAGESIVGHTRLRARSEPIFIQELCDSENGHRRFFDRAPKPRSAASAGSPNFYRG